ncbi:DUF6286 domain-containing protein [Streptomyces sp. NBC_00083]|uniref:DUF6286 domain-containing protein n=1 Tax=Streptomyces sp. NBC_00083 TaxID=2975647 RepID=UPI002255051D|nr:DUF6286 domain-containing protein [Streptomyces sp. NBC_00083]MCX5383215.1 DUF6286 domain-containing protein [Streptomyces sp. NBC_00083]
MSHPQEGEDGTQRLPVIEQGDGPGHGPGLDQAVSAAGYDAVPVLADGEGGRAGRFWSVRRVPSALLALVILAGAGLLLYDVAAVRAHRSAMSWRVRLADWLATHPVDDVAVLAGAAAVAAIGIWLVVLAVTPGLRSILPMRRPSPAVHAGLDRAAAALVLRDRAMEVSGIQSARVRMGRRRVVVRAHSHFRELDDVRADLDAALGAGIRELGLAGPPGLAVRVNRPVRKG